MNIETCANCGKIYSDHVKETTQCWEGQEGKWFPNSVAKIIIKARTEPVSRSGGPFMTDRSTELKPCPFCGGPCVAQGMDFEETVIQYGCSGSNECYVHPVVTSWAGDMDEIIVMWNTRKDRKRPAPEGKVQ